MTEPEDKAPEEATESPEVIAHDSEEDEPWCGIWTCGQLQPS